MDKIHLLVGSYNIAPFGNGEGLSLVTLDTGTGKLERERVFPGSRNPSYLAKNGAYIYAVQEMLEKGSTNSYRLDDDNELHDLGTVDAPGGLMCHITLWPGVKFASATNYLTGSLVVFPVGKDGPLGQPVSVTQYSGHGPNLSRQAGPHTHSSTVDPSGKWLAVAELGIDRIFVYRIDGETGTLTPGQVHETIAPAGSGPRHLAFSRDGKYLYVTAELQSRVLCYGFDSKKGVLNLLQNCPALPDSFAGENLAADIHLSPDGKFLYASNRGHDSVAVFAVGDDGLLQNAGWFSAMGQGPRHFRLIGEDLILIANQGSGNLVCCRRDPETGALGEVCSEIAIPAVVYSLPV